MAYKEKLQFLVNVLAQFNSTNSELCSMISVVTGNSSSFAPDLFQVIKCDDKFYVQELKGNKSGHEIAFERTVKRDDLNSIPNMCPNAISMELSWGEHILISYAQY